MRVAITLPHVPRWIEIVFWLAATLVCARLIYLPQARALGAQDAVTAAPGQWLVLDGLAKDAAINLKVPLAGTANFSAPRASIDPPTKAYLDGVGVPVSTDAGPLNWAASSTGAGASSLVAILSPLAPDTRIALSVAGAGRALQVRTDRGALAIAVRLETDRDDTARGLVDAPGGGGPRPYAPWRPLTFVLAPGVPATLNFAGSAPPDVWLQGDGVTEGPLPLTGLERDAGRDALTRTCGGPAGATMFWSALLQPRAYPIPERGDCRPGYMALAKLAVGGAGVVADPSGSAYLAGELPLLTDLKGNLALKALILALIAYPGGRLMGLIKVGK